MTDKEALKLAIEALEGFYEYGYDRQECFEHITAIKEALAEHAMQKVQRLGQEIEHEPKIGCVNHDCEKCKAQTQEPVETYIHEFTKLPHPGDFGIPKGHWWQAKQYADALYTTPPQRTEPVTDEIASIIACRDMLDAQPVPPREST